MKRRDAAAARLEADYIARVRSALAGREASEIDEIVQSVKEHIESELSEAPAGEVSEVRMSNVLERLGPPEAYSDSDGAGVEPNARPAKPSPASGFAWDLKTVVIIAGLIILGVGLLALLLAPALGLVLVALSSALLAGAFRPSAGLLVALVWILLFIALFGISFRRKKGIAPTVEVRSTRSNDATRPPEKTPTSSQPQPSTK